MKIQPKQRQSLADIAIQTLGAVDAVFDLAVKNDLSVSDALGKELEPAAVADNVVLQRCQAAGIIPSTDVSPQDMTIAPFGGIGFMGIEIDFIVSE